MSDLSILTHLRDNKSLALPEADLDPSTLKVIHVASSGTFS